MTYLQIQCDRCGALGVTLDVTTQSPNTPGTLGRVKFLGAIARDKHGWRKDHGKDVCADCSQAAKRMKNETLGKGTSRRERELLEDIFKGTAP